jgi:CheY-like chemotaxis protein
MQEFATLCRKLSESLTEAEVVKMTRNKSKIVIVDDSPLFRAYLKKLLAGQYDLEVIEISTARELHSYLSHTDLREVALVLLDLHLPDGNGLEVLQKIKTNHVTRDLDVIIVSAYIDKTAALQAARAGASDLVVKPFRPEELLERLDRLFAAEQLGTQIYLRDCQEVSDYNQHVNAEIKRAKRAGYPLTILLTGFFRCGSLSSPLSGDDCHRNIALGDSFRQLLRESLRETDSVLSRSPNELLLLLPFTGREGCATVLQNLGQAFEKTLTRDGCGGLELLTAAVTFPDDGPGTREIISTLESKFKELLDSPRSAAALL